MPNGDPTLQPAFESGKVGPACQRCAIPARACTLAIPSNAAHPVKEGAMRVLFREERQKLAERGQYGEPSIPTIAVTHAKQCRLPDHCRWQLTRGELPLH